LRSEIWDDCTNDNPQLLCQRPWRGGVYEWHLSISKIGEQPEFKTPWPDPSLSGQPKSKVSFVVVMIFTDVIGPDRCFKCFRIDGGYITDILTARLRHLCSEQ
jgi:hypothetical protein